ncbi:hypothetical protein EVAR_20911_1 [Eumeta japonica]|uniref:Uncharacterized protein n=1 Tax=Eumeta variegata TaxID=151549 RepID=A0A4C1UVJ7_EUMVA|nr:hypothetical protein EVAR_20911_1 [Eumeta japonica]
MIFNALSPSRCPNACQGPPPTVTGRDCCRNRRLERALRGTQWVIKLTSVKELAGQLARGLDLEFFNRSARLYEGVPRVHLYTAAFSGAAIEPSNRRVHGYTAKTVDGPLTLIVFTGEGSRSELMRNCLTAPLNRAE